MFKPDPSAGFVLPYPLRSTQRSYFSGRIGFDRAVDSINLRRCIPSFLFYNVDDPEVGRYCVKSKASFRGNDVYRARVWNRHKELLTFCELNKDISFINWVPDSGFNSSVFKFTLTVDPGGWDRDVYNKFYSQYFYDLFIKRIRNLYPSVVVARSTEVSTKRARGYVHFNVVAVFPDDCFPVFLHTSKQVKNCYGEYVKSWRLRDYDMKTFFGDLWDPGFVDVRSVKDTNDLAEYTLKYHLKYFRNDKNRATQDLTLSTLSLYDKRAFSFPRESVARGCSDFCETVIDYTVGLDKKQCFFPRLDIICHNSLIDDRKIDFEGFFVDYNDDYDDIWYEIVDKPPDSVNEYENWKGFTGIDVELCSRDDGFRYDPDRWDDDGDNMGHWSKKVFVPGKYTRQVKYRRSED